LRKQARNRDEQHEAETTRLIEQVNVSHEHERKRSHRMMETLRKPRPDSRYPRDQRDHHHDRDVEPNGFTKLWMWLAGLMSKKAQVKEISVECLRVQGNP
jgi:hypothetical protein